MSRGNEIVVSAQPVGKFDEGIVSGTPLPGVCMELKPGVAPVNGRFTYTACQRAIGKPGEICVLLPDRLQGKTQTDAYTSGTLCSLYWPVAGEELNMLVEFPGTGAGGVITTIGERLCVAGDGTGALTLVPGAATSAPFKCLEADVDLAGGNVPGNALVWVKYLGNNA